MALRPMRIPLVAGLLMLVLSACTVEEFPAPPRNPHIVLPVTVSPDGRIITVRAAKPCGQRPLLVVRSYPHRVTLHLVNQHVSDCHVEAVGVISISVRLPSPLRTRPLVDATNGKRIRYHVSRLTPKPHASQSGGVGMESPHPPLSVTRS